MARISLVLAVMLSAWSAPLWAAAPSEAPKPKAKPAATAPAAKTAPQKKPSGANALSPIKPAAAATQAMPPLSQPRLSSGPPPLAAKQFPATELANYRAAITAAESGGSEQAQLIAAQSKSDVLSILVEYIWITRPGSPASFDDIVSFQKRHGDWPSQDLMRRRAEALLADEPSDSRVLDWFGQHPPQLGEAQFRYGEALSRIGKSTEAERLMRQGWVEGNFGQKEEVEILQRYGSWLQQADHQKRMNRLLWEGDRAGARRMMTRVDSDWKALAEARMGLQEMAGNVERLVSRVPAHLQNDPGLIYERVRWRRIKGLDEDSSQLLLQQGVTPAFAEKWWVERQYHARRALAAGAMSDAYRLAARHGLSDSRSLAEAEFLAGWIALRFLRDPKSAMTHFSKLAGAVKSPISLARGAYWAGRAAEDLKDRQQAQSWYGKAAAHSTAFYGQLATARLGRLHLDLPNDPTPSAQDAAQFERRELARAAMILAAVGEQNRLRAFIMRLADTAKSPVEHVLVAQFAERIGRTDLAVAAAKRSAQNGTTLARHAFPIVNQLKQDGEPELPLVLALSRQESEFRPDAISRAGARGLMQLMPATAQSVAKTLGVGYSAEQLIDDPGYNAKLGRHYLKSLLDNYDANYVLTLAAYNAGPGRVQKWVRDWGDPRRGEIDVIDWIELIPFTETRNYVQRVLEGVQVYRQLTVPAATVRLRIEEDLRGGIRRESCAC